MRLPDYRLAPTWCPYCGALADAAANATNVGPPKPGDATLCWACGAWSMFTETATRRAPNADEVEQLALDEAALIVRALWLNQRSRSLPD